jgi:hypothetical protein
MAEEHVIYSEPAVTIKAKNFLTDDSQSEEYKKATEAAVSDVVSAIRRRIDKSLLLEEQAEIPKEKAGRRRANRFFSFWRKK